MTSSSVVNSKNQRDESFAQQKAEDETVAPKAMRARSLTVQLRVLQREHVALISSSLTKMHIRRLDDLGREIEVARLSGSARSKESERSSTM